MSPSTWNLRLKWPSPLKSADVDQYYANVWTEKASEQSSQIGSRQHVFQRAIDEVRTLPLSPPSGGSSTKCVFLWTKFKFSRIKSATKFLCVKTSSSKGVVFPLSNGVYMLAVNVTFEPNIFYFKSIHPFNKSRFRFISALAVRASKMCNYNLQKVDYQLSNELKINRIRYS